jgi:hypothetical protein
MGKSTLSRLGAGRESSFFIVSRPNWRRPFANGELVPGTMTKSTARVHQPVIGLEAMRYNVSTVASKSRTPPETAARVLIGAITEPGRAMPALERGTAGSPQGLTYRGLNSLCSLVVNHRTVSANGCGRTQTKMS